MDAPMSPGRPEMENDVKFVIKNANPIGQDTAVYELSKYQMPANATKIGSLSFLSSLERKIALGFAQLSILLARSSGRDKLASVVQYGSMFWGNQTFFNFTGIEPGPEAPWVKLEESMSNGRKVFRLLKWFKEYERARFALTCPNSYLSVVGTKTWAILIRVLAVLMNTCSFMYYLYDNLIWAAQANLINRSPDDKELRKILFSSSSKLSLEKFMELQRQHNAALKLRKVASDRVNRWKDWKNYWSLGRLVLALFHDSIQIRALRKERSRLQNVYSKRITLSHLKHSEDIEEHDEAHYALLMTADELETEQKERVKDVTVALVDFHEDVVMGLSHLGILLSRLQFKPFNKLPLWSIGILGVIGGYIGCKKNFPSYVPAEKQNKVFKRRSTSIDIEMNQKVEMRSTSFR